MNFSRIGIGDLSFYLPKNRIALQRILARRVLEFPGEEKRYKRAVESTNQTAIRYPDLWEDAAVLGANAAHRLLEQRGNEVGTLRYFVAGTETSVDHSKPISAYIQGMLDTTAFRVPTTLSNFQVQHACAGATLAMLSVAGLLQAAGRENETGLIIASDIARYDAPSTAEFTQGAGSAAMLIEKNPRLVGLDLETMGFSSRDVDDFFRPLGSTTAKVKGRYSIGCYHEALDEAFLDYCSRIGSDPDRVLGEVDYFVFHVPFARMAESAVKRLLQKFTPADSEAIDRRLERAGFFEALEVTSRVGNVYTGAIYLNLMATLHQEYQKHGESIIGRNILFSSYGSGNTMVVFGGRISPAASTIIKNWRADDFLNHWVDRDYAAYEEWLRRTYSPGVYGPSDPHAAGVERGAFFLQAIREDGYREYRQHTEQ